MELLGGDFTSFAVSGILCVCIAVMGWDGVGWSRLYFLRSDWDFMCVGIAVDGMELVGGDSTCFAVTGVSFWALRWRG